MEFCTRRELVKSTGHDVDDWPLVVLKELVDNALDAAEEAEVAPVISIAVQGPRSSSRTTASGIPAKTIDGHPRLQQAGFVAGGIRLARAGQQGNALTTILPMSYVLDAQGRAGFRQTIIESHGVAHHIAFDGRPRQTGTEDHAYDEAVAVVRGTRITVDLPA